MILEPTEVDVIGEDTLVHYGVLGMKWGIRRYQPYPNDHKGKGKFLGKMEKTVGKRTQQNTNLENKIIKTSKRANRADQKLVKATSKLDKQFRKGTISKKHTKNLSKAMKKSTKYNRQIRDYDKRIRENERFIKFLEKEYKSLSGKDIYKGKILAAMLMN